MASTGPRRDTQEGLAALDRCVVGKSRCLLPLRNPSALSAVESLAAGGVPRRPEARRVSRSLLRGGETPHSTPCDTVSTVTFSVAYGTFLTQSARARAISLQPDGRGTLRIPHETPDVTHRLKRWSFKGISGGTDAALVRGAGFPASGRRRVATTTTVMRRDSTVKMRFKVIIPLLAIAAPAAGQDAAAGEALYGPCAACHGPAGGGNKDLNAPAIAGQEQWYVVRQLQNFKAGARGAHAGDAYGVQMAPMAQALATDADVSNVSAYVASLPPTPVTHDGGGDASSGEALYATCAACHGQDGRGMESMNAPNLTLQQDWYVVRQILNFKAGVRGSSPGDSFGPQMAPMAAMVTDEQAAKDLAAYISTLGR